MGRKKKHSPKQTNISGEKPCEICMTKTFLVEHHIDGRKITNMNHPSNLCNVCPNCHYSIHLGKIIIERWAMTTSGKKLLWHTEKEESFTGYDASPHVITSKSSK